MAITPLAVVVIGVDIAGFVVVLPIGADCVCSNEGTEAAASADTKANAAKDQKTGCRRRGEFLRDAVSVSGVSFVR
ncbi:hypothetical protein [Luteimonas panaciterrae]|uniref:hypothetical protein n=1 Tax=Luteimonas panaciterrae TaxID=363885 RepID=UPI001CFBF467|nr:hypothetical protein [Luteimonas panaciterrae]